MKTVMKGKIINAPADSRYFDGMSPIGFEIEVVSDEDGKTKGFYIYFSKEEDGRGYDEWFEKEEYMRSRLADFKEWGWVIEW